MHVAQLEMNMLNFKIICMHAISKNEILKFDGNIFIIHKTFASWDFICNLSLNLNRMSKMYPFLANTNYVAKQYKYMMAKECVTYLLHILLHVIYKFRTWIKVCNLFQRSILPFTNMP